MDPRLLAVAAEVRGHRHLDIGSDHGYLPRYLLETGRIAHAIVVEKTRPPYELSCRTLAGLPADVVLGDGLEPIDDARAATIDSLSITGMGATLITAILARYPHRLPPRIVVQPNDGAEQIRRWAIGAFHLANEQMVAHYEVVTLVRATERDPSYAAVPEHLAFRFGPRLLARRDPRLRTVLETQHARLAALPATPRVQRDLALVREALAFRPLPGGR